MTTLTYTLVFILLKRMLLNPNGKIDKPVLPFPDNARSATAAPTTDKATLTEEKMRELWSKILPNAPHPLLLEESFSDLGGHSVLATRLIFEIHKSFVVGASLGLIFDEPTISGLVKAVEALRNADKKTITTIEYGKDYDQQVPKLHYLHTPSFRQRYEADYCLPRRCNWFLGGVCDDEWVNTGRLEVLTAGNLRLDNFGLGDEEWSRAAEDADAMLHDGALVHWVYPYEKLWAANVISTLTAIELASTGKQKLVFVSSTSAINTEHYVRLSESPNLI
ncbi:uncharacterized protein ARMOST_16384 [Armillaria ostoyae]|uniref:Carrier domain-containing protein n=1 Tax=Armillaria ostoyae TaxID=47428 RepID=A0A284RW23_ARMOS|nr:uncharacterized protein ARMOST_16384 [Armillaria ostoyae]